MTTLPSDEPSVLVGSQVPRISTVPDYVSTSGKEAVELAAMAGLDLDPWQQLVLVDSLGEREDGKWASFEVGVVVSRQNGKGGALEAIALYSLFVEGGLTLWTAHELKTSDEAYLRVRTLIKGSDELAGHATMCSDAGWACHNVL